MRRSFLLACASFCLAVPSAAQDEEVRPFLSSFPRDHDNVFLLHDVVPHLESLLANEALRQTLVDGSLGRLVASTNPLGPGLDPRAALTFIREQRHYIPENIGIAFPNASMEDMDHMIRLFLFLGLTNGAIHAGPDAIREDLPGLRERLLAELEQVRIPRLTTAIRMRQPEEVALLFGIVRFQLGLALRDSGIELEGDLNAFGFRFVLADLVDEEVLGLFAAELGVSTEVDEHALRAGQLLGQLSVELWFENLGSDLRLTLGPRPDSEVAGLRAEDMGRYYESGASEIAFGRWRGDALHRAAGGWLEVWDGWQATPVGRATTELDEEDMLGSMVFVAEQLLEIGTTGALRLFADSSLKFLMHEEGVPSSVDLRTSSIRRMIPAEIEAVGLSGRESLADQLEGVLVRFEERLSTNWLKADLTDDADRSAIWETVTQAYYRELDRFRRLVFDEGAKHFVAPSAAFMATRGRVTRLAMHTQGESMLLEDVPMAELAILGTVQASSRPEEYLADTYHALMAGLAASFERELEETDEPLPRADLGLGVPTRVFHTAWIAELMPAVDFRLDVEGDLRPHLFVIEDVLVLSTSARLSREIIATTKAGAEKPPMGLPRAAAESEEPTRLVGFGRITGKTLVDTCELPIHWIERFEGSPAGQDTQIPPGAVLFFQGLGELGALIDEMEWTSVEHGDQRTTQFDARFSAAARKSK